VTPSPSGPELAEAMALLGQVFRGFKRNAGGPPPAPLVEAFERGALGPRHMPVLMTATVEGPLSVSELAERVGLTVATTSLLVGELDREGFVERSEDDHDRRRTLVQAKPRYRRQLREWANKRREPMRRALGRMTPDERAALTRGLRVLDEEVNGVERDS
jgi:DNA-binding MarR family transcriptional regulator